MKMEMASSRKESDRENALWFRDKYNILDVGCGMFERSFVDII
jgi:hypothetical protein